MRASARREPAFENQLVKKGARVEMFRRRQILERARDFPARRFGTAGGWFGHGAETLALETRSTNLKIQWSRIYRPVNLKPNSIKSPHASCASVARKIEIRSGSGSGGLSFEEARFIGLDS